MSNENENLLNIYSNFMKYTINSTFFNLILIIFENMPVVYAIDNMFPGDVIQYVFTPLYYLAPTFWLDLLNQNLPNECTTSLSRVVPDGLINSFANDNDTNLNMTTFQANPMAYSTMQDIYFFQRKLTTIDTTYCMYSSVLVYVAIALIIITIFLIIVLSTMNARKLIGGKKTASIFITNILNLIMRPFGILILTILVNRPLIYLYYSDVINPDSSSIIVLLAAIGGVLAMVFFIVTALYLKFVNNAYYFERYPYDYFTKGDYLFLLTINLLLAFKQNYLKFYGLNNIFYIQTLIAVFIIIRTSVSLVNKNSIVNNVMLKTVRNLFSIYCTLQIVLKLINQNFIFDYPIFTIIMEIMLIIMILVFFKVRFLTLHHEFLFVNKHHFIEEVLHFFYHINKEQKRTFINQHSKTKTENFFDRIIVGHKMKCNQEECVLCSEDIYRPDQTTLLMVLYQQFLKFEKLLKEEHEGECVLLKILFLKYLDEKKIHRISLIVLKNAKIDMDTYLKMFYLYNDMLDDINKDLKNLLTIKYGEIYDEMLQCINGFEDILGLIKSRTEKVELIINKTNEIGIIYNKIEKDLFFMKRNRRIYFDASNMVQIITIIRLVFQRQVDTEISENLEYNFPDFFENIDKIFEDNISFLIRYDFLNRIWRMKKIPKKFIDMTNYKISDLIDQSLEKIFPSFIGKTIIKRLEDFILSNIIDTNLSFKTFICDSETNVKYVKFEIDIVPNLDGNYILLMNCHFHKRQLVIVDENGNFVNGSEILYEKMGINAEIITKSKGKINMYNVFNLSKSTKLEEVKIVSISDDCLYNTTKRVFLLETQVNGEFPDFLEDFVNRENNRDKKKNDSNVVYMNLFETMNINDVKYHVFTIKVNSVEDRKQDEEKERLLMIFKARELSSHGGKGHTVEPRETISSNEKSEETNEEALENLELLKKIKNKGQRKTLKIDPDATEQEGQAASSYNNYLEYYNCFYDGQQDAMMNLDKGKKADKNNEILIHEDTTSVAMSVSTDLFTFLYIKTTSTKKRSNNFENFLYGIYTFNFCLVLFGLISIFYLNSYSSFMTEYLNTYYCLTKFQSRMFSTTANLFTVIKLNEVDPPQGVYKNYIINNINNINSSNTVIDYDYFLKMNMKYHAENIMTELNDFFNSAYNFFGNNYYSLNINFATDFIYFNSIGNYIIRQEITKNEFGLFSLSSNELATSWINGTFVNISYLDFGSNINSTTNANLDELNMNFISKDDNNQFQSTINIYQYLFNYFSVFYTNVKQISVNVSTFGNDGYASLQTKVTALLIVIIILNILFVLISFLSILIYKRILLTEFQVLYSINEDQITKLKEKYKYVRELIKLERYPSKVYNEIRRSKESEQPGFDLKKNLKKKKKVINNSANNEDDNKSMMSTTSTPNKLDPILNDDYLKFAGATSTLKRTYTKEIQVRIDKIKKENSRNQASVLLLKRLNFQFEIIKKFIVFIVIMTIFYLAVGALIIYMIGDKYNAVKASLEYSNLFLAMNSDLYNYYVAVKLSIMMNKPSPYTLPNDVYNQNCAGCNFKLVTDFNNMTSSINTMQAQESFLNAFYLNDQNYQGDTLCQQLYSNPNDLISYLKFNSTFKDTIVPQLQSLCQSIPIMHSNLDSIFNYMIVNIREIEERFLYLYFKADTDRIYLLQNDFLLIDILFGIFVEPYSSYVKNSLIYSEVNAVNSAYFQFIIIVFTSNIFIDFFILVYIWFNIYKQIITSVLNINLVTDSVRDISY